MLSMLFGCRNRREVVGTVGTPVDLGLSVLWSDHNLGASQMEETGKTLIVKTKGKEEKVIDVAHQMWRKNWYMPTAEQLKELAENCRWVYDKKRKGYDVIGPNGKSIFMPKHVGKKLLDYWSSDHWINGIDSTKTPYISFLYFSSDKPYLSYADINPTDSLTLEATNPKCIRPVIVKRNFSGIETDSTEMRIRQEEENKKKAIAQQLNAVATNNTVQPEYKRIMKIQKEGLSVQQLKKGEVIPFTTEEFNKRSNTTYNVATTDSSHFIFNNNADMVAMRFSDMLAFVITVENPDSADAKIRLMYNNGKLFKQSTLNVPARQTIKSQVFYADKDTTTTIFLNHQTNRTKLNNIHVYHGITVNIEE